MTNKVEHVIFEAILGDEEYTRKALHHIESSYFDSHLEQLLIKEIKRFYSEHNRPPTKKILQLFVEDAPLKTDEYTKAKELLENLGEPEQNREWLIQRTEQFCKDKAIYNAIKESIGIIDGSNTKFNKEAIPTILQEALGVSFDKTVGHDYFADAEERYNFYHLKEDRIPFDLSMFNKITKGGLPRKTLSAISAGTGVGKSLFMCHHAAASIKQGLNALYISLEMAEERIAERIDCNLLEVTLDELQRMKHTSFSDKIEALKASTHGKLKIKEFPTAGAHVGHFKSLLDDLKMKQNFVPDIIYIDYINICASQRLKNNGSANSYTIVKSIAEELRGFAVEYDVPILTATQVNRGGMNNTDVELTDTSESFGLPMTLDFMFALIRTEELDGMGQLMVKQLKSRFGDINYYKRFVIGIDLAHFRLFDSDKVAQENIHDAGRTEDDVPLFDKSKKWQAANIDGLDFS